MIYAWKSSLIMMMLIILMILMVMPFLKIIIARWCLVLVKQCRRRKQLLYLQHFVSQHFVIEVNNVKIEDFSKIKIYKISEFSTDSQYGVK